MRAPSTWPGAGHCGIIRACELHFYGIRWIGLFRWCTAKPRYLLNKATGASYHTLNRRSVSNSI